jgi:hypothetical protein
VNLDSLTTIAGLIATSAALLRRRSIRWRNTTSRTRPLAALEFHGSAGCARRGHRGRHFAGRTDKEMWHAKMVFRHFPWTLKAAYNRSDFYDFFGPTKVSRKGHGVVLERSDFLIARPAPFSRIHGERRVVRWTRAVALQPERAGHLQRVRRGHGESRLQALAAHHRRGRRREGAALVARSRG